MEDIFLALFLLLYLYGAFYVFTRLILTLAGFTFHASESLRDNHHDGQEWRTTLFWSPLFLPLIGEGMLLYFALTTPRGTPELADLD